VHERAGDTLETIGISKDFLWNSSCLTTKRKGRQMGLHEIKKLLHKKRNVL
jgi:hypothetical protein